MTHYLIKFIFYTSGVIGLLLIAFLIAKNSLGLGTAFRKKEGNLTIEESLPISPRKTLHIIKAFDEKFLIASDATSTTLLAKLNANNEIEGELQSEFKAYLGNEELPKTAERPIQRDSSVIKSMLNKLNK